VVERENEQQYLGNYDTLFDRVSEVPFISWKAIEWMLKDTGMVRRLNSPPDKVLREKSDDLNTKWTLQPPVAVANDPRFCPCERRYRWDPAATIDSVEYNWPRIPGPFYSPEECATAYSRFFEQHRHHHDPVCFRAAVYSAILAFWCRSMRIVIDINYYEAGKREFWIFMRLQYSSSKFTRLLEAMAISNFIAGAHHSLMDELSNIYQPCQRFLTHQSRYNYRALKADEHLFQCLQLAQEWERKRNAAQANQRR
jgi:hypothetical protein